MSHVNQDHSMEPCSLFFPSRLRRIDETEGDPSDPLEACIARIIVGHRSPLGAVTAGIAPCSTSLRLRRARALLHSLDDSKLLTSAHATASLWHRLVADWNWARWSRRAHAQLMRETWRVARVAHAQSKDVIGHVMGRVHNELVNFAALRVVLRYSNADHDDMPGLNVLRQQLAAWAPCDEVPPGVWWGVAASIYDHANHGITPQALVSRLHLFATKAQVRRSGKLHFVTSLLTRVRDQISSGGGAGLLPDVASIGQRIGPDTIVSQVLALCSADASTMSVHQEAWKRPAHAARGVLLAPELEFVASSAQRACEASSQATPNEPGLETTDRIRQFLPPDAAEQLDTYRHEALVATVSRSLGAEDDELPGLRATLAAASEMAADHGHDLQEFVDVTRAQAIFYDDAARSFPWHALPPAAWDRMRTSGGVLELPAVISGPDRFGRLFDSVIADAATLPSVATRPSRVALWASQILTPEAAGAKVAVALGIALVLHGSVAMLGNRWASQRYDALYEQTISAVEGQDFPRVLDSARDYLDQTKFEAQEEPRRAQVRKLAGLAAHRVIASLSAGDDGARALEVLDANRAVLRNTDRLEAAFALTEDAVLTEVGERLASGDSDEAKSILERYRQLRSTSEEQS